MWPGSPTGLTTGHVESAERLPFHGWAHTLGFLRNGQALVAGGCEQIGPSDGSACKRGVIRTWSLGETTPESAVSVPKNVTALNVSPDGKRWVAGDVEGRVFFSTDRMIVPSRPLHQQGEITALAFSPDGKWVASGSADATFPLGLIEVRTGGMIHVKVSFDAVSALAFSPEGKELVVGTVNGGVSVWKYQSSGAPVQLAPRSLGAHAITGIALSSDGRWLAYSRQDGRVFIRDRASGRVQMELKRGSGVSAVVFSPDSRTLAVGHDNGKTALVDIEQGREVWLRRHVLPVTDLAYSPDGASLAVAAQQNVYVYRIGEGREESFSSPRARLMNPGRDLPGDARGVGQDGRTHTMRRLLEIAQDEYVWLLPFDKLVERAVEAMAKAVPGGKVERNEGMAGKTLEVHDGARRISLGLAQGHSAVGRAGISAAIREIESARNFFADGHPESRDMLGAAAFSGLLDELDPGVRLVSERGELSTEPQTTAGSGIGQGRSRYAPQAGGSVPIYVRIADFSPQTVRVFRERLGRLASAQADSRAVIVDFRDNAGGEIEATQEMAEALLPSGAMIGHVTARSTGDRRTYRSSGAAWLRRPVIVLVNERTSGTAELLACATRQAGSAVLVGSRTAGVDEIYRTFILPGGAPVRVSVGRFECPDGNSLRWAGQEVDADVSGRPRAHVVPRGVAGQPASAVGRIAVPLMTGGLETHDRELLLAMRVAGCVQDGTVFRGASVPSGPPTGIERSLAACGIPPS